MLCDLTILDFDWEPTSLDLQEMNGVGPGHAIIKEHTNGHSLHKPVPVSSSDGRSHTHAEKAEIKMTTTIKAVFLIDADGIFSP